MLKETVRRKTVTHGSRIFTPMNNVQMDTLMADYSPFQAILASLLAELELYVCLHLCSKRYVAVVESNVF